GYDPVAFQIDSFIWFVLQLACMWWLFARIVDRSAALLVTAVYALHPVCAETVNYIVQRGEIISTCGVVAALPMYAGAPGLPRTHAYWVPFAVGVLAKPPAMVFPALLFAYVWVVERRSAFASAMAAVPSLIVTFVLAVWIGRHTPPTFVAGGQSTTAYWLTQPFVWLRYAFAFFAPIDLSADNDWPL